VCGVESDTVALSRYFQCAPNHGVLLKVSNVMLGSIRTAPLGGTSSQRKSARVVETADSQPASSSIPQAATSFLSLRLERDMHDCGSVNALKTVREQAEAAFDVGTITEGELDALLELFAIRAAHVYQSTTGPFESASAVASAVTTAAPLDDAGTSKAAPAATPFAQLKQDLHNSGSVDALKAVRDQVELSEQAGAITDNEADTLFELAAIRAAHIYTGAHHGTPLGTMQTAPAVHQPRNLHGPDAGASIASQGLEQSLQSSGSVEELKAVRNEVEASWQAGVITKQEAGTLLDLFATKTTQAYANERELRKPTVLVSPSSFSMASFESGESGWSADRSQANQPYSAGVTSIL
jgi:hypothetical protein